MTPEREFLNLVGQAHGGQLAVHGGRVSLGEGWVTIEPFRAVHTFMVWSGWLSMPGAFAAFLLVQCLWGGGLGGVTSL
jgi:hypothetical protein